MRYRLNVLLAMIVIILMPVVVNAGVGKVVPEQGLNVRLKSNSKSAIVGSVGKDEELEIIGETKNWYKIKYDADNGKKYGFVIKKYVKKLNKNNFGTNSKKNSKKKKNNKNTKKSKNTKKIKSNSNKYKSVIITGESINVREKNSMKANVIGCAKAHERYKVIRVTKNWIQIEVDNGIKGYISRRYARLSTNPISNPKTKNKSKDKNNSDNKNNKKNTSHIETSSNGKQYQSIIVATDLLNVRKSNSQKSEVIATIQDMETYPILEQTENWVKIALTSTKSGYVLKKYVDFSVVEAHNNDNNSDGEKESETENKDLTHEDMEFKELKDKLAVSDVSAVNVRKDTNIHSPILAILLDGATLNATGESDDWVRVVVDEDVGYIKKEYVNIKDGTLVTETKPLPSEDIKYDEEHNIDSKSGEAVVAYAKKFLGNKYVWGGTSLTNGTDCSGFVQSIYKHFGYNLKRTSYQQRTEGVAVSSLSEAIAGDIICYDGHVGIYLGNGKGIIHASNPTSGIIITSNASYRPIVAIRRIIQ